MLHGEDGIPFCTIAKTIALCSARCSHTGCIYTGYIPHWAHHTLGPFNLLLKVLANVIRLEKAIIGQWL